MKNPLLDPVFFPKVGFEASEKLRSLCTGAKIVKIRWPHAELHEAAVTIDRLVAAVVAYRAITQAAEYAQENKLPAPEIGAVYAEFKKLADEFCPQARPK